jgi:hypothetical protein
MGRTSLTRVAPFVSSVHVFRALTRLDNNSNEIVVLLAKLIDDFIIELSDSSVPASSLMLIAMMLNNA